MKYIQIVFTNDPKSIPNLKKYQFMSELDLCPNDIILSTDYEGQMLITDVSNNIIDRGTDIKELKNICSIIRKGIEILSSFYVDITELCENELNFVKLWYNLRTTLNLDPTFKYYNTDGINYTNFNPRESLISFSDFKKIVLPKILSDKYAVNCNTKIKIDAASKYFSKLHNRVIDGIFTVFFHHPLTERGCCSMPYCNPGYKEISFNTFKTCILDFKENSLKKSDIQFENTKLSIENQNIVSIYVWNLNVKEANFIKRCDEVINEHNGSFNNIDSYFTSDGLYYNGVDSNIRKVSFTEFKDIMLEKVLPKKYAIKARDIRSYEVISQYFSDLCKRPVKGFTSYFHYPEIYPGTCAVDEKNSEYTELTFKQFKSFVLDFQKSSCNFSKVEEIKENSQLNKSIKNIPMKKSIFSGMIEKFKSQYIPTKLDNNVRLSMNGDICIYNNGEYISIDKTNNLISFVSEMTLDIPIYAISKPYSQLKENDIIVHNNSFSKVVKINKLSISSISYSGNSRTTRPIKDFLIGESFVKVVFNMFGQTDFQMNPMMLMMMSEKENGESSMIESLMMMQMMNQQQGTSTQPFNPMMLMMLSDKKEGESSSMMETMMMMQMMQGDGNNMFNMFSLPTEIKK